MVAVIPRSTWGARYKDGAGPAPVPFSEWWLHHSVTIAPDLVPPFDDEYAAMRTLEDIGQQRFAQGISYTWPIMPNGRVYQGHSVNTLGAHTGGRNSIARAICFVGNYDVTRVTPQQIESAAQLMAQEYRAGRATRYTLNGGHQQLKATTCPGRYGMEAVPIINARAEAIHRGAPPLEDDDMPYRSWPKEDSDKLVGDVAYGLLRTLIPTHLAEDKERGGAPLQDVLADIQLYARIAADREAFVTAIGSRLGNAGVAVPPEVVRQAVADAFGDLSLTIQGTATPADNGGRG